MESARAYHGSGCAIDRFDYSFTGQGNDEHGGGFYFTTDLESAASYCGATLNGLPKPGGIQAPTVHEARLTFSQLLDTQACLGLTLYQAQRLITASPNLRERLDDWDDVQRFGVPAVLRKAALAYAHPAGQFPLIKRLHNLANDFFGDDVKAFNLAVRSILGFDGVCHRFDGGTVHYVAFFPEQIDIIALWPLADVLARIQADAPSRQPANPVDGQTLVARPRC